MIFLTDLDFIFVPFVLIVLIEGWMLTEHPARCLLVPLPPFAVPARGALHVTEDQPRFVNGAATAAVVMPHRFAIGARPDLCCSSATHCFVFLFLLFRRNWFGFFRTDSRFTDHKASDLLSESDFFGILFRDVVQREKSKAVEAKPEGTQRSRNSHAGHAYEMGGIY